MGNSRRFYAILCALCVTVSLSACSSTEPPQGPVIQTVVTAVDIPSSLRACPPIPRAPDPDTATQRAVSIYIVDLNNVAEHCKRDLNALVQILDDFNSLATDTEEAR